MVPSLTETLIAAGVNVVGRTRFCIHPEEAIKGLPVVGGTKDINWDKVKNLQPDLLIFDQEENPRSFAEESSYPFIATHIQSCQDLPASMNLLAEKIQNSALKEIGARWEKVLSHKFDWNFQNVPGEILCLQRRQKNYSSLVYVIWKNPWMAAGAKTFIGSVLEQLGARNKNVFVVEKYPTFEIESFSKEDTYFLFSSEPYPFHKKNEDLKSIDIDGSIIDGEAYSWFGLRSLTFIESQTVGSINDVR
jgi:ABC-type Fe3+-hydroxamate transport system substrate-binding protein